MESIVSGQEFVNSRPRVILDGNWEFSYDPKDIGVQKKWFAPRARLPERITVPGCSQARRFHSAGKLPKKIGTPAFAADPESDRTIFLKYSSMAPAWFRKTFSVPGTWKGKEVWLHVGGVKPAADIWINSHKIGTARTSRSPVRCNLTRHVRFGGKNTLAIRVFWPMLRLDGMFDCIHVWSGIYRSVWIEAAPQTHIADLHVVGELNPPSATVNLTLHGKTHRKRLRAACEIKDVRAGRRFDGETHVDITGAKQEASFQIPMPRAKAWSPDDPNLYEATVRLVDGQELIETASARFGLREIHVDGHKVLLNGQPVFLRGGCDDQIYPETVCPPASKEFFVERIRKAKRYGFNYTKSCVGIFIKEFLDAADEVGYMVCQEMPFGLQGKHRNLKCDPPKTFVNLWKRELGHIIISDRSHPSVIAYSMASELGLSSQSHASFRLFNQELPAMARRLNPQALLYDVTHTGIVSVKTKYGKRNTDLMENCWDGQGSQCPLTGPILGLDKVTLPFILHEYNWWCYLPNLGMRDRYSDLPIKPHGIPEMIEAARRNGLQKQLPEFVEKSRKLRDVLRKDGMELARKHPKIAGYHFWLIHDFSFCPEGVFNEFWEEPDDLSPGEFRTYNDATVLLLDDRDRRDFESGEEASLGIMLSHFGSESLDGADMVWRLRRGRTKIGHGEVRLKKIRCGSVTRLAEFRLKMPAIQHPAILELSCELAAGRAFVCRNHWPLWVFPATGGGKWTARVATNMPLLRKYCSGIEYLRSFAEDKKTRPVLASDRMHAGIAEFLERGGWVVLFSCGVLKECTTDMECLYRTVPFNTGSEGNMGTVIRPHGALGRLRHDGWCDLPFAPLIQGAYPMDLSVFQPKRIDPIIRSIGHHLTMRDKAYLFEIGVGEGCLIACSLRLEEMYESSPLARYLVEQMLSYASTTKVRPQTIISPARFRELVRMRG